MCNLYTKFAKILEICNEYSNNLVNEQGNIPRRGLIPKFSDLEVVAYPWQRNQRTLIMKVAL